MKTIRLIFRHIFREPVKTLFLLAAALFFTLSLGILQNTMTNLEVEINRLYAETAVSAELRLDQNFRQTRRPLGDAIPMAVVEDLMYLGAVQDMYLEGVGRAFIVPEGIGLCPFDVLETNESTILFFAVDDLRHLTQTPTGFAGRGGGVATGPENMQIEFASGFGDDSFINGENDTIPLIISEEIAERQGISLGNRVNIVYYAPILFRTGEWIYTPATVIGIHNGEALPGAFRMGAVIPLPTMKQMFGYFTGFLVCRFTIDPYFNHDLEEVSQQMTIIAMRLRYPWRERLMVDVWDQELRIAVAAFEQHLALLRLLFPIALITSIVLGAGLTMLVMLQNAKIAAILRVLGMSTSKTRIVLWCQQIIICTCGVLAGVLLTNSILQPITVALPYLGGAIVGAVLGAILVTNKSPIDLLQVKE